MALACHVNPDADALGSMLGLANFLEERGVRTTVSFPNEPLDPPRWAAMLPGSERLVSARAFPREPGVMVTCDCASADRLVSLLPVAERAGEVIWIDHHRSNDGLGTIPLVDPQASSTCEMVFRLIEVMGGGMSDATATCLYAGLVTDTGRFQYEATTPETLRVAAVLRAHHFDHARLVQALYEDNRLEYIRLVGTALDRLAYVAEADLVWTYLTQADLQGAGVRAAETDDLIDAIRTARDVDVAAVVKQQKDGRFKVSVRSRGGHDLSAVAASFGGGGHRLAAGLHLEARSGGHRRPSRPRAERRDRRTVSTSGPDGLVLIDKPGGITSHDAVAAVRRALGTRKVGHAGTLDPMATGLLLMGVGRATRLLRFLGDLPKTYEGSMRLGVETDTLDADGVITREVPVELSRRAARPRDDGAGGRFDADAPRRTPR